MIMVISRFGDFVYNPTRVITGNGFIGDTIYFSRVRLPKSKVVADDVYQNYVKNRYVSTENIIVWC